MEWTLVTKAQLARTTLKKTTICSAILSYHRCCVGVRQVAYSALGCRQTCVTLVLELSLRTIISGGWSCTYLLQRAIAYISREEFSLHYTSIDDAVKVLLSLGSGAIMANVDLKSAFRMVPVRKEDWQFLEIKWINRYTWPPIWSTFCTLPDALQWILRDYTGLYTTWKTTCLPYQVFLVWRASSMFFAILAAALAWATNGRWRTSGSVATIKLLC